VLHSTDWASALENATASVQAHNLQPQLLLLQLLLLPLLLLLPRSTSPAIVCRQLDGRLPQFKASS
jgi:hypothetical protein